MTAVWAGSAIGFREMVERIRPEDFDITYRSKNRLRFMGNGRTKLVGGLLRLRDLYAMADPSIGVRSQG